MIWIFLICLVIVVLFFEKKLSGISLKQLTATNFINTKLAEPDENITFISKIYNKGFFPIMYIKLTEHLPLNADIVKEGEKGHKIVTDQEDNFIQYVMYLMPHMRRTFRFDFSLPERGKYIMGNYTLTAGDFLGINDSSANGESPVSIVIMPRKSENTVALKLLGGFIGDISVRRFILEDPITTIGFKDYTGREPFKSISWSQTARAGKLQTKQYDHTIDISVSVILNVENGSKSRLESCYSLTRSVCEELEKKHIPYDFYTNGDISGPLGLISYIAEGLGPQHLNTILYGLGCAKHKCIQPFETMIKQCMQHQKQNQGYIIISPPLSTEQRIVIENFQERVANELCVLIGEYEEN